MCCPHGHAYVSNPDFIYDYDAPDYDPDIPIKICKKSDDADGYNPQFWNHTDREEIEFTRHEDYILSAHNFDNGIGFSCPSKNIVLTPSPADMAEKVNLKINGDLEFKGLPNYVDGELKGKIDKTYDSDNYCIVYTQPPDYSDYDENNTEATTDKVDFQFTHMVCSDKMKDPCFERTKYLKPVLLSLSVIFLFLTLFVYIFEGSQTTKNPLTSKMTIAFIVNLTITFIILIDQYVRAAKEVDDRETGLCIATGYLMQYFLLSYFFWVSAMSFDIWHKFANMALKTLSQEQMMRKFVRYCVYAQGIPLLIVIITASVDSTRGNRDADNKYLPNMGIYNCFLSRAKLSAENETSYFGHPIFLYYQGPHFLTILHRQIFLLLVLPCYHWLHPYH